MTDVVHIEAVDARARGLRTRRASDRFGPLEIVRRMDALLLLAVLGALAYGLWAIDGITKYAPGSRWIARPLRGVGLAMVVALSSIRRSTAASPASSTQAARRDGLVLATGGHARLRSAGSPQAASRSAFRAGKLLLALCLAAFVADRVGSRTTSGRAAHDRSRRCADSARLRPARLRHALVYGGTRRGAFVSGIRWVYLAAIGGVALVVALAVLWVLPAAGINVLKPYQAARLTGFTHPASDPSAATYQVTQSITTVGAGGFRGRGVAGATQTTLGYLPADTTDFAFASLAEQRGFLGVSVLLLLYLLIVWRGLRIVAGAGDLFGATVAPGSRSHSSSRLRERRHDDRDADHRHTLPFVLGRRLVDDQQPHGDGDPAGIHSRGRRRR